LGDNLRSSVGGGAPPPPPSPPKRGEGVAQPER